MRKIRDLKETYDGDLVLEDGDLADTKDDYSLAAAQIIKTILNTKTGESEIYPDMGFDFHYFEGLPNTEETGKHISKAIKTAIVNNTIFFPFEVNVDSFPISSSSIAFKITLTNEEKGRFYYLAYDTKDNRIRSLKIDGSYGTTTINTTAPPTKNHRKL